MPSISSLVTKFEKEYPQLHFEKSEDFRWISSSRTITYLPEDSEEGYSHLLHELSHALLDHTQYSRDVELLEMERDAWTYAKNTVAPANNAIIPDEVVSEALDSYRDWLHKRSTCPRCEAIGLEKTKLHYYCPACRNEWRVNEARSCGLRRTDIKNSP